MFLRYTNGLQKSQYDRFVTQNTELAVQHILKPLSHVKLLCGIHILLTLRRDEFNTNFHHYIRIIAAETRKIDAQESDHHYSEAIGHRVESLSGSR